MSLSTVAFVVDIIIFGGIVGAICLVSSSLLEDAKNIGNKLIAKFVYSSLVIFIAISIVTLIGLFFFAESLSQILV